MAIELTYEKLPVSDWGKVAPYFEEWQTSMPDPRIGCIYAAEDENGNISFVALQLQAHAEPLFIHPEHRGTDVHKKLAEMIERDVPTNYYAFVPSLEVGVIAASIGMKALPWKVYVKEQT